MRHVCLHARRAGKRLRAKDHAIAWSWSEFLFFILVGQVQLPLCNDEDPQGLKN
ncbi:MAG: hypothetical protein K8953_02285 [Proteobacteria bacterium]|nr:hypothetical protein [Pseudomonadota bacterium]